ncbi:MAG TPA: FAD-dependent oxidoreductase, partial [Methylomirabilota bacterium]|nr:FAD-dependent oxidoreductase [Methylomirabilota bacterium]
MGDVQDVLIVGGGAAGYTAGIFAARDRCRALLLEKFSAGGQVLNCEHITNFPGFPQGVAGYTLGPLLQEQATAAGLQVAMNEVTGVRRDGDLLRVETDGGAHTTRTLIVAS